MKKIKKIFIILLFVVFSSCIFKNQFYTEKDLIQVPQIIGTWIIKKGTSIDSTTTYKVAEVKKYNYDVTWKSGNLYQYMKLKAFKVDNQAYFDVIELITNSEGKLDTLPKHDIFKYYPVSDENFKIVFLNYGNVVKGILDGKIKLKHSGNKSDDIYITAPTMELQIFLKSIKNDAEFWDEEFECVKYK